MHKTIFLTALLAAFVCCTPSQEPREALLWRLESFSDQGLVAYGHQDDLSYGHSWMVEDWQNDPLDRSDVKDATGKYPMVLGFDLGGIELGDDANLDGVPFGLIRKAAKLHASRGGIVTFSWHLRNPLTGGDSWDISSDQAVASVLPGGPQEEKFCLWLQRLGDFLESLGPDTPFIFRPWHENVGSWFWWGGRLCTASDYRELFRLTHDYLTDERDLDNIVWCYSPNGSCSIEDYMERYPGDDCVDLLGIDSYEYIGSGTIEDARERYFSEVRSILTPLKDIAEERDKILCLSETGLEGLPDPAWWTGTLAPLLEEFPVAYVLTWRNAHDKPSHFYAAWEGFEGASDMKAFCDKDNILFLGL